jgi:hypothetical protein
MQPEGEFDSALLNNELIVLYGSESLKGKSPYEVLQRPRDNNVTTTFEQTYKLADLIFTIQAPAASAERILSALKRIKIHLRLTRSQDVNSHLCRYKRP